MQVFTSPFVPPDKGSEMARSHTISKNLVVEASSYDRLARDLVIFLTNIHGGLRCLSFSCCHGSGFLEQNHGFFEDGS